ncbi:thioredoxin family protein [Nocardioides sp. zg-1308]|uniref:Thioredoxin family protein n=1 Tax=Nocardioides renjunii TaxID=3095075 RepID=A0ABU5K799_9ACTN|nr:thioredoxin domain-containing protein [Nocardioides sp. S-58]MDZ5660838.1 thioredoxin family protein [Nocardioides sp. S-58]NPD03961.1 thioredoxin family protein [Nocardioides sp. zg-1308]
MSTGAWIAVAAVVVALAVGGWRLATDGRFRGTHVVRRGAGAPDSASREAPREASTGESDVVPPGAALVTAVGGSLGQRATLLQFSSAFCAPCRATRRVLDDVSGLVDGVVHVEVDAEQHLDATRALGILRTPTTIVLDRTGAEVTRATGAPTKDQVLTALAAAVSHHPDGTTTS